MKLASTRSLWLTWGIWLVACGQGNPLTTGYTDGGRTGDPDAASAELPRPGPFKGSPKLRARVRAAADYLDAMRTLVPVNATAPMTLWVGPRDDDALRERAEREGLRGPVQRLLAALDLTSA